MHKLHKLGHRPQQQPGALAASKSRMKRLERGAAVDKEPSTARAADDLPFILVSERRARVQSVAAKVFNCKRVRVVWVNRLEKNHAPGLRKRLVKA